MPAGKERTETYCEEPTNKRQEWLIPIWLLAFQIPAAQAQEMDRNAMMRWASADLIRYDIVGVYEGTPGIASDHSGRADVADRVEIELKWKLSELKLVGTPSIRNTKSSLKNPRDIEPSCLPRC